LIYRKRANVVFARTKKIISFTCLIILLDTIYFVYAIYIFVSLSVYLYREKLSILEKYSKIKSLSQESYPEFIFCKPVIYLFSPRHKTLFITLSIANHFIYFICYITLLSMTDILVGSYSPNTVFCIVKLPLSILSLTIRTSKQIESWPMILIILYHSLLSD